MAMSPDAVIKQRAPMSMSPYGQALRDNQRPGIDPLTQAKNQGYQSGAESADASMNQQQIDMMKQLKGLFAQGGGGGTPAAAPTPGATPQLQMADNTAAQAAEFARAKDQAGQVAAGALKGLRSSLGSRGMLGSGLESRGTASVMNQGQQDLAGVSTAQAQQNAEALQRTNEANFQGGVTQRGQDIQQRGQDIQQQEQQAALKQQLQLQQANMIMAALRGGSY